MNKYVALCFAGLLAALPAAAQDAAQLDPTRAALKKDFERVSSQLVQLAEAIPVEKYDWKPAEGVRSIGEVYTHIAGANFFIAKSLGVTPAEGAAKGADAKADALNKLNASYQVVLKAIDTNADLAKGVNLFGMDMTVLNALLIFNTHAHEHLGQSIAYARSVGVTPPWSKTEG